MNVNAVLQHYDQQDKEDSLGNLETPPVFGMLTQTLIRSPLVHWILPARFRSSERNDVAFIGVRHNFLVFVQPSYFMLLMLL